MPETDSKIARHADAIVVGAGAGGLMGALAAAHCGADVLLVEKDLAGPSNLRVSGGLFPGAGTKFQRQAGIQDDAQLFASDIRAKAGEFVNQAIVEPVARRSPDAIGFLSEKVGLPIHVLSDLAAPGHSVARLHATPAESGRELHAMLRDAAARHPRIRLLDGVEVTGLVREDALFGILPGMQRAPSVLLATGGFAANRALLEEFIPGMAAALHIGAGPNDGCAIVWGRQFGARLALMDGYQGQGHVNPATRTRLGMALPGLGAFMVNADARRFVREDVGPSELAALVLAQPGGVALEVFDQRIHDIAMRQGPYREAWSAGAVRVAEDPAALARLASMDAESFRRTFDAFAQMARTGGGDPLGRKRFGPPLAPPLYAAWVTGALAHTQGGLAVDRHARVLRADGSAIGGLFAAGGAAAGLAGRAGEGYLPGNGLAQSFALGLIAAEGMAAASLHPRA
jgi:fumarate reductase flavoprotein subunit